jgi:2-polyprenyl-6-methoxyphenol hydroxylase-like FAD-dependent oxidoreductase
MAIEDAAVLGKIFSHITSLEQIQPFLEAYQSLRLPRVTKAQSASRAVQKMFFPDVDIGSRYKSQQELGNKQTEPGILNT